MPNTLRILFIYGVLFINGGCGGSSSDKSQGVEQENTVTLVQPVASENLAIPDNSLVDHYKVLLIGNSHVVSNNLSEIIKQLINTGKPHTLVTVDRAPGGAYLDDRVNDGVTLEKIQSDSWTHTILQAQKYSQSGSVEYPTHAAENWIEILKIQNTTPILFPEHPQRGNPVEAQYVHDLHLSIIEKQKSCLAPIGLAWDKAIAEMPSLTLHAPDGNHAAYAGSFLTALIFYQVITGELADSLPFMEQIPLSENIQRELKIIASQILDENQACDY